jgi:rubrerythrin
MTMMKNLPRWRIDDLPWEQFNPALVDQDLLKIVKAASLVEYNASDYTTYLSNIFADDKDFCGTLQGWSDEETQHGAALGAWATKADPSFDFNAAFARYKAGYRINVEADASIRGSNIGELIARCVIETGTSSYYTALGQAAEEPVLKALCGHIAADEIRHYKMFYKRLEDYLERGHLSRYERFKIGMKRIQESEDDELAYAYYAANAPADAQYDRPVYTSAYMVRAFPLYKLDNLDHMVTLVSRACGFKISGKWRRPVSLAAKGLMRSRLQRAYKQAS